MVKDKETCGFRSVIPVVILCGSIALAVLFSGGGVTKFLGRPQSELAREKQELRDNRNLLLLQLSICQRNTAKANDAYICPGGSVMYKSLGSSPNCRLAQKVAEEFGVNARILSIMKANQL